MKAFEGEDTTAPVPFARLDRRAMLRKLNYIDVSLEELEVMIALGSPDGFMRPECEFYYHIYYTHLMEHLGGP